MQGVISAVISLFQTYKISSGLERFHGKVAEIGPGDSCGIGLMFLADGCRQVDLVDRFFSARDEQQQQAINRALVERFPQLTPLIKDGDFSESSFTNLKRYYGKAAAAETFFERNKGYDFIVSTSVFEHVYDPLRALLSAVSALNPGGMMLHQVDCQDHGQFSEYFHELKFLELPSPLYSPLKWGGGPNRVRLSSYTNMLREAGMDFVVYINSLAGIQDDISPRTTLNEVPKTILETSRQFVSRVRCNLARPFRDMSDEDLMITRFLVVARKTEYKNALKQSGAK